MKVAIKFFLITAASLALPFTTTAKELIFLCVFKEYNWKSMDGGARILPKEQTTQYIYQFDDTTGTGLYKNTKNSGGGKFSVMYGSDRYTLIEDTWGDNAFIVSIFNPAGKLPPYQAISTVHSVRYGVKNEEGTCK